MLSVQRPVWVGRVVCRIPSCKELVERQCQSSHSSLTRCRRRDRRSKTIRLDDRGLLHAFPYRLTGNFFKEKKMRHYIIKFIPKDDSQKRVIHKIAAPDLLEKGFYRQSVSFDAFRSGKRADATKRDKECYRDTCCWSPIGLYSGTDFIESEWLRSNEMRMKSLRKFKDFTEKDIEEFDETKWPVVHHKDVFAFYEYIGFDRKKRTYI